MSFGTGALKVSREGPEEYKHHRETSMATRQVGTTQSLWAWDRRFPKDEQPRTSEVSQRDSKHHQAYWLVI